MEDKQIKAIDAYINHTARAFGLEPFVVQKPERKIMKRFFQGIGATLLVIVIGFVGVKFVQLAITKVKLNNSHFKVYTGCGNCYDVDWHYYKKGQIILGNDFTCTECGILGKMSGANTLVPIRQKDE